MEIDKFIEACREELTCKHCGATITGAFCWDGGGMTSNEALIRHEEECSKNPDLEGRLLRDIKRCQFEARIYHCLNCQHYHKKCNGTKN